LTPENTSVEENDMGWSFRKKDMPSGLWMRCPSCEAMLYRKQVQENLETCPECDEHFRISSAARIDITVDEGSFRGFGEEVLPKDVLEFQKETAPYSDKLEKTAAKTGLTEAVRVGFGELHGIRVVLAVLDFGFLGGSMGMVVGERVTMAVEAARDERVPLLIFSSSGGARMHEGALSLMQMAKTSAAIARFRETGVPYISILTNPTTGGVTASFAALGDLIYAEPGALIGFAGPRVIQTTIRADLPEGFQRSEFLLEKGFIDRIVSRSEMRDELARTLEYCLGNRATG
jgi:acetyl-CoA carboxylase carboxyl transferase subunit beta